MNAISSRRRIHEQLDALAPLLFELSDYIHAHPELGHQEFQAQAKLAQALEEFGFIVERGVGGFPTAFKARPARPMDGPTVAFVAEYDALPELGHACGHNLICTAAVGAAAALAPLLASHELSGEIIVIGTPAEEIPPPVKIQMLERGVFNGVDVVLMSHGLDHTWVGGELLAIHALEFQFTGKASHAAASPEQGISALDAAFLTAHAIELLREHVPGDVRIHGVITEGGQAPNIVPERAAMEYYVRARNRALLEQVVSRVENCARAGALATGASVTIKHQGNWDTRLEIQALNKVLLESARDAGADCIKPHTRPLGSSDFGSITQRIPAATLYINLVPEGTSLHTASVAEAAGGEAGHKALLVGAKAMACTAYDLLSQPDLLAHIKHEFSQTQTQVRTV